MSNEHILDKDTKLVSLNGLTAYHNKLRDSKLTITTVEGGVEYVPGDTCDVDLSTNWVIVKGGGENSAVLKKLGAEATATGAISLGYNTEANNEYSFAAGKYNESTTGSTLFSVGIGSSDADRKNAFEITSDGNLYYGGASPENKIVKFSDIKDKPSSNEIWYTTTDGQPLNSSACEGYWAQIESDNMCWGFELTIVSNTYENGMGKLVLSHDVEDTGLSNDSYGLFSNYGTSDYGYDCGFDRLKTIILPDSVTSIGNGAFEECYSLTSIVIPDSVTSIGTSAFNGCTSLTSVTIPDSVTSIGYVAFYGCTSLASVYCKAVTPPTLSGTYVFDNNASGRIIYVPIESVDAYKEATNWSEYADYIVGCVFEDEHLVSGTNIKTINGTSILGSGNINVIIKPSSNEIWYTSSDDSIIEPTSSEFDVSIISNTYSNGRGIITFDGDVTSIGESAFASCSDLTSIEIPDGVTSIGMHAFSDCYGLISITIPDSVTSIGDYAFYYCSDLTSIEIPDGVTSIGEQVFGECYGLISVYCKATTPPSGGSDMFWGNASERKIYVPIESVNAYKSATNWSDYGDSIVGCVFEDEHLASGQNIKTINGKSILGSGNINVIIKPSSNEIWYTTTDGQPLNSSECENYWRDIENEIGTWDFYLTIVSNTYENGIGKLVLSHDVEDTGLSNNGYGLFSSDNSSVNYGYDCGFDRLETIILPDDVTSIGNDAFSGCYLISITIPNSVTSIGGSAFSNCYLTSITIPNSVTSIGNDAFSGCSSLTSIEIPNSVTSIGGSAFYGCSSLTSIEIPNSVTSIGAVAFWGCSSLTSIEIPNSVTLIEDYAFYGCSSLTSIKIPDGVTSIGDYAFYDCISLTSIKIPDGVTLIGEDAFYNCGSLTSFYCKPTTPPTVNASALPDNTSCKFYVPIESVNAYKSATNWANYGDSIVGSEILSLSDDSLMGISISLEERIKYLENIIEQIVITK